MAGLKYQVGAFLQKVRAEAACLVLGPSSEGRFKCGAAFVWFGYRFFTVFMTMFYYFIISSNCFCQGCALMHSKETNLPIPKK